MSEPLAQRLVAGLRTSAQAYAPGSLLFASQ